MTPHPHRRPAGLLAAATLAGPLALASPAHAAGLLQPSGRITTLAQHGDPAVTAGLTRSDEYDGRAR